MHYLTIHELSDALRRKTLSPVEVTGHTLDRIARIDGQLNSYVTVLPERAIARAKAAEAEIARGHWRGPLHGVTIAVKDNIFTDFAPTTGGSSIHKDYRPPFTATAVQRLEAAGAIIIGKVKTTEFAWSAHHPSVEAPRNPWKDDRFVGVSSSGSGVSTAAGLAYAALGTDTGASVRMPAAANGLTGLKPSWGRVSRHGVFLLASSFDVVGPLARDALDAAILLGAIAGHDGDDPTTARDSVPDYVAAGHRSVSGLRIGLPDIYRADDVDPVISDALDAAAAECRALGATIHRVTMPDHRQALSAFGAILVAEAALAHDATFPSRESEYGEGLAAFLRMAPGQRGRDVAAGYLARIDYARQLDELFASVDVVLLPTIPAPVPTIEGFKRLISAEWAATDVTFELFLRFMSPFNLSGHPSIVLPCGFDHEDVPLSMQFVAPRFGEEALIQAAAAFQRATSWHMRHPPER